MLSLKCFSYRLVILVIVENVIDIIRPGVMEDMQILFLKTRPDF